MKPVMHKHVKVELPSAHLPVPRGSHGPSLLVASPVSQKSMSVSQLPPVHPGKQSHSCLPTKSKQMPLMQLAVAHSSMSTSHAAPVNPGRQAHLKNPISSTQVVLLVQLTEWSAQWSILLAHNSRQRNLLGTDIRTLWSLHWYMWPHSCTCPVHKGQTGPHTSVQCTQVDRYS